MSSAPSGVSTARNPWPCTRCGVGIEISRAVHRLPWAAILPLLLASGVLLLYLPRVGTGLGWNAPLAAVALFLVAGWGLYRRRRALWRCPRCRLRAPPRLRPAGPPTPAVAVPTYNNVGSIADVVARTLAAHPETPLIVVDDGSTDGTGDRAREALADAGERAVLLRHPRNRGKGAAITTALRHALEHGHSHVVTLDGDGQHHPEDLETLLASVESDATALWVGARDLSGENVQGASRFGRRFSNFWLRALGGARVDDSQCGFRAYPVAPVLSLGIRSRAFDFEVEVLTLAARAGIPLRSVPIQVHYPPPDERVSHFDKLWDNVRISWANTRLLFTLPLWPLGYPSRPSREEPPAAVPRAWSGRSRGGALGHLTFLWMVRLLGPRPAYLLLYPVAFYFMFFARSAVRASQAFLDRSVGPAESGWARFWRTYRHVLTFAQCILDRAIVLVRGTRDFEAKPEGYEHLHPGERGAIYLSAHLGNWEVAGAFLAFDDVPVNVVMVDSEAEAIKRVYARFGSDEFKPKIIAINRSELPALKLLAALRDGEAVALHGDRIIDQRWVWCDFLGTRAPFPTGAFTIAASARVPVILTFGFKVPGGYRFIAEPPRTIELPRERRDEALAEHARWYAERIEHYARAYPYQWFNFYDFWTTPEPEAGEAERS